KADGIAHMFNRTIGSICYVFPEDQSKQTSAELKASTIQHKMNLNISGAGIYRIVESWLRERKAMSGEGRKEKKNQEWWIKDSDASKSKKEKKKRRKQLQKSKKKL